ncbi:MAG: hypothetical protein ACTTH7_07400 [Treponema sp.]
MRPYRFSLIFCSILILIGVTSCASSMHLAVRNSNRYTLSISCSPGKILESNIKKSVVQNAENNSVFNTQEIMNTFAENNIKVERLALIGAAGFDITCTFPADHSLLQDMVTYDAVNKKLQISIEGKHIHNIVNMLPEESRDFIDTLMAPLFTGEALPLHEYEELISVAYGKKLAEELKSSEFKFIIDVPYPIVATQIKPIGSITFQNGKIGQATVRLPLMQLLCTVDPIEILLK